MLKWKIAGAVVFIVILIMAVCCGWALDDSQEQKTISGRVVDTDWVKSVIIVNYFNPHTGSSDEISIIITSETKITRGTNVITLSDVLRSDQVTVIYYDDGLSGLKAIRVTDLNRWVKWPKGPKNC